MKQKLLLIQVLLIFLCFPVHSQDDVNLFDYWKFYSYNAQNSGYITSSSLALKQLQQRDEAIARLETKDDYLKRQDIVREKLLRLVGPFPEKTPLNARVTGIVKRDGYRVENLIYESMPGYFVTASLFIPDNLSGRSPAILNAIGHSPKSYRRDIYQNLIINLVKKGFIVLAYDQIGQGERLQYYSEELGKSRFRPNTEHSYPGAQCFISGYSPARYFIWDGIRAIDYLLTRKEVDPQRIGMTGLSGGGTSTSFVSAIDDRILAAAPSCYITNYKYLFMSEGPQDAEQNIFHFLKEGLDHADLLELRAPKPTLIVSTTRDFFSIQGVRETFQEAKRTFRALGNENQLQLSEADLGHGFIRKNNEATYAFFQKYLNNPGESTEEEVNTIPEKELQVTETGQMATSLSGETIYSLNKKVVEAQVTKLNSRRLNMDKHIHSLAGSVQQLSGFEYPKEFGNPIFSGRIVKKEYSLEKYLIQGSGDYQIPAALFLPEKGRKSEIVILLDDRGMDHAANQDSLSNLLVKQGLSVLLVDIPGIGEMGPGYMRGDAYIDNVSYNQWFAGILTGKSLVGLRAEDIVRITHFIKTNLQGVESISAIASGTTGSGLLHAALFDSSIQKVCLKESYLGFADIALSIDYVPAFIPSTVAGAIEEYDLQDLMAGIYPRKLMIVNPLSGNGTLADRKKADDLLSFPNKVYEQNANFSYTCENDQKQVIEHILEWFRIAN
jgi:dienelactone hydrolase